MKQILLLLATLFLLTAAAEGQPMTLPDGQVGIQYTFYANPFCGYFGDCGYIKVVAGTLPPGLSAGSGQSITGVPTQAGVFNFTLSGIGPASITIVDGGPEIQPGILPIPFVGAPYNAPISALGGKPPYKWSAGSESGSLPPGLSLVSSSTGEAIAGTPTQTGLWYASIDVVDATGAQAPVATLKITVGQIVTALPDGTVGISYSGGFTAQYVISSSGQAIGNAGGFSIQNVNTTFALSSGSLPPGLSLAPSGAVSGTPTAAGTFPFKVTALGGTYAASITVKSLIPVFSTTSLPGGTVGQAYFQKTVVIGGFPPYSGRLD